MVVGEGAGVMVLESKEHAMKRAANIIATFKSWSRLFNDPNTSAGEKKEAAIESSLALAINNAGMSAADIGMVNASASGVIEEDRLEAQAIRAVLGGVPVSAHKSNFGNLGPGTSVVELIGGLLAIERGKIPPTINYENVDPNCPVDVVAEARELKKPSLIKTGFSATGQIASVVFAKD